MTVLLFYSHSVASWGDRIGLSRRLDMGTIESMLRVKTSVRLSPIHGLGLFAAEPISKGQVIWVFDPKIDSKVTANEFEKFTESRKATVNHFGYQSEHGHWIICGDGGLFINHSDEPNCDSRFNDSEYPQSKETVTRASRNILEGEELTTNYMSDD